MGTATPARLPLTRRLAPVLILALVYLAVFVGLDFLRFPPEKDEVHFWPTVLAFSTAWIPSLDQLRGYHEMNTPLPFILFGALEHAFHGGIAAGRLVNLLLSFGLAATIALTGDEPRRSALSVVGLLLFPYYLGVGTHLYTDTIAAAFVLFGLMAHLQGRPILSALCWAMAISSRQYSLAFPIALAAYEFSVSSRPARWLAPLAGASTMGLWFWFFGGPAPVAELARQQVGLNRLNYLHPSNAIYLLVCVGAFYVIPELVFFPPSLKLRRASPVLLAIFVATVLAALFVAPLGNHWGPMTMGFFDVLTSAVLGPIARALFYGGLAGLAVIRFAERSPAAFLVAANAGVLVFGYTMWEKYALALLVCLWYLRARLVESSRPRERVMPVNRTLVLSAAVLLAASAASAQQLRFDDVIRNLRNPDAKIRLGAVRLLRDAKYPEAVAPLAPLVLDPLDDIQLETIDAELSFFLEQDVKAKRMIGFVIEKRKSALSAAAFDLGPLVVWPRPVPPELVTALLQAVDDTTPAVRIEAIYALGVIAKAPLDAAQVQGLIKSLDHYDPAVRAGAARVVARLKVREAGDALIKAVNDSKPEVRYAAMRALGAIRDGRAVAALAQQLAFYKKGEGAWSALDALGQIGDATSVPIFKERLQDKDPYIRRAAAEGLGRAGDTGSIETLEKNVTVDESKMVRLASAFALQKLGQNYAARLIDLMSSPKMFAQGQDYLIELGPPMIQTLLPRLQDPDPDLREALIDVLGVVGDASILPVLEAAAKDRDDSVASAAKRATARIHAK